MLSLKPGEKNLSLHYSSFCWFASNLCHSLASCSFSTSTSASIIEWHFPHMCLCLCISDNLPLERFPPEWRRPVRLVYFCKLRHILSNFCGDCRDRQEALYSPRTFQSIIHSVLVYSDSKLPAPLSHLKIVCLIWWCPHQKVNRSRKYLLECLFDMWIIHFTKNSASLQRNKSWQPNLQ